MTSVGGLVAQCRDFMKNNATIGDLADYFIAYTQKTLPNPITKKYVVLNIDNITSLKESDSPQTYTYTMDVKMSFNIHIAESGNGSDCLTLFSQIMTVFESSNTFRVSQSGCGQLKRDSDTNSIYLPCYMIYTVYY